MAVDNTAKANGRGENTTNQKSRSSRAAKTDTVEATPDNVEQNIKVDNSKTDGKEAMSTDNVVQVTPRPAQNDANQKQTAIELHQPTSMVWNRPVMPSDIEIAETISEAGIRPIAVSHLALAGSFLNGRPIEASSLTVREMLPGDRPVFSSEFKMVEGTMLPGNRPIMASNPDLLEGAMILGNRPIASNEIVDPEPAVLMGYLD